MSDKLRTKLAQLPPAQVAEIKRAFLEAARAYSSASGVVIPAEVLLVSGRKDARP
jgi:hypothetical protein